MRGYQYRSGGNGSGVVWALPADAGWPSPAECVVEHGEFLSAPRPSGALDNFMDAMEGDQTPWSLICASLFAREAAEIGAMWHGVSWAVQTIFGEEPWRVRPEASMGELAGQREDWTWLAPAPDDWRPAVEQDAERSTVTFFSFDPVGVQTLVRNMDTFVQGSLAFTPRRDENAHGFTGAIF